MSANKTTGNKAQLDNIFSCRNLDDFLVYYGDVLGQKARATLDPLHVPGRDALLLPETLRRPYEPQAHVIQAAVKALHEQKSVQLICEMGSGKTLMAAIAAHAHAIDRHMNDRVNRDVRAKRRHERRIAKRQEWALAHGEPIYEEWSAGHDRGQGGFPEVSVSPNFWLSIDKLEVKSFEWAGKAYYKRGGGWLGRPGQTRCYSCTCTAWRRSSPSAWKGQVVKEADAHVYIRESRWPKGMGMLCQAKGRNTAYVLHDPRNFVCECRGAYRAILACPGQLVEKWVREITGTIPGAVVYVLEDWRQVAGLARQQGRLPLGYEWYVMAKDRLKLSSGWQHAHLRRSAPKYDSKGRACGRHWKRADGSWAHDEGLSRCPRCGQAVCKKNSEDPVAAEDYFKGVRRECLASIRCYDAEGNVALRPCREQLWQETTGKPRLSKLGTPLKGGPRRYAPARIIQKKMKHFFDYGIFDEAHEYKAGDSLQGDAMGNVMAAVKKGILLTGTLVGGYAWHVRTTLFRAGVARSLIDEGFGWMSETAFNATFGRLETKETIYPDDPEGDSDDGATYGRSKKRGGKSTRTTRVCPGIMPTLFRHLMGSCIFLQLEEVADNLPPLDEQVHSIDMDPELRRAYTDVDEALMECIREMVRKGNKKVLSIMLQCLLAYPDYPFDWGVVGYYDKDPSSLSDERVFVPVVKPANLDPNRVYPKEQAILDWVLQERAMGRQAWVYCTFTQKRDCLTRLDRWFRDHGLKTAIMRADVPPAEREAWIDRYGPSSDVILSHPDLVKTGLDFFNQKTGHNYCSIAFYQTGYNLFTLRQAARRAWRIGQKRLCRVAYFFYQGSMQERAMGVMGRKLQAAQALEGKFSTEGLAAMAGDEGNVEMALAQSLAAKIDESQGARAWKKVTAVGSAGGYRDAGAPAPGTQLTLEDLVRQLEQSALDLGITLG